VNKRIKKLWVAALRSGEYKQARGQLRRGDSFCCLGVLCNLHAQAHPDIAAKQKYRGVYMSSPAVLPLAVAKWADLKSEFGGIVEIFRFNAGLPYHNDRGSTFSEIADAIEAQL
jgi:hypothetical protein